MSNKDIVKQCYTPKDTPMAILSTLYKTTVYNKYKSIFNKTIIKTFSHFIEHRVQLYSSGKGIMVGRVIG